MSDVIANPVHATAVAHAGARIAASARIGPYCVIGDEVEIGEECDLMAHVYLEGPLCIGPRNQFFPYSSIGVIPQDKKFKGERTETVIGTANTFREFVTVHRGTRGGGGVTRIGDDNLVMAYTHIAHDCIVGSHTVLANGTTLAGHVLIEDYAVIGAFTGIHQFCRVGRHSIIGGYSVITKDVMPFSETVSKRETTVFGINKIGLERHGFSVERRNRLRHAFQLLLSSKRNTSQAVEQIQAELAAAPAEVSQDVDELIRFIQSSERGVIK